MESAVNSKIILYFVFYILLFLLSGILIIRVAGLSSLLFFSNDYATKHFGEMKPLVKVKNKKLAWLLTFLVPIPISIGLLLLRRANIGDFLWYLSFFKNPKTAFLVLSAIYFMEALMFLIIKAEQKLSGKIEKRNLILAILGYSILIISIFVIAYKFPGF